MRFHYRLALVAILAVPTLVTGCFESDPEHTEYFPNRDGSKPEIFELAFVQVCEGGEPTIGRAAAFAKNRGLWTYEIPDPGSRILATYTFGLPMRAHLQIERLYRDRVRVGVSTFRGYPTPIVTAARKFDFCKSNGRAA